MRRSEQRRGAVFALYQHDLTGREVDVTLPADRTPFMRALAYAVEDYQDELDATITRHAHGWKLERIGPLERAVMRVALLELLHPEAVPGERPIPPEVAIDQAVETAKTYCGPDASGFVNGILAAALRERAAAGAGSAGTTGEVAGEVADVPCASGEVAGATGEAA